MVKGLVNDCLKVVTTADIALISENSCDFNSTVCMTIL